VFDLENIWISFKRSFSVLSNNAKEKNYEYKSTVYGLLENTFESTRVIYAKLVTQANNELF